MDKLKHFIEIFETLDQESIYEMLMDLGSQCDFPEELKNSSNFVNGCQSQVWVVGFAEDNQIKFIGTSDSFMVRGVVYLICDICSDLTAEQLEQVSWQMFEPLGQQLTHQRRRGMQAIINQIRAIIRGSK